MRGQAIIEPTRPAVRTPTFRCPVGPLAAALALLPMTAGCGGSRADDQIPAAKAVEAEVPDDATEQAGRNRLADESSPYLLQHAENPVHWYAWGPEAFEAAEAQDKPIFLSVGYRSCYWCHVMERECFEDEAIAALLNEHFIAIKVDREERPDVDQVYMTALQAINNGSGGWPMSLFLTPDGRPFYGGTYFPPVPRNGMPSFPQLLDAIQTAWDQRRPDIDRDAEQLADYVRRVSEGGLALGDVPLDRSLADAGAEALAAAFDPEYGGFGADPPRDDRPKFPEPSNLAFLLDRHRRGLDAGDGPGPLAMVETTLDRMSRGGIRDHLAGGYHRYSTDRKWQVPHFEKMLYDNAQLATVFLEAFEQTEDDRWRVEAVGILDFVLGVMADDLGAFHATLDAEAEGTEGAPYVWTREEVAEVLDDGPSFELFARCFGLDEPPNFEGDRYVLHLPMPLDDQAEALSLSTVELRERLEPLRAQLLEARRRRAQPFEDETVLTSWNGLMIGALADGARVLDEPSYRVAAERAADFLLNVQRDDDGRLLHASRDGEARVAGYLEDYAYLIDGLLRLQRATGTARWLDEARALADRMVEDFDDEERGGFFHTADGQDRLIARIKDPHDGALPGPNAVAIGDLIELHRLTGSADDLDRAGRALESFAGAIDRSPAAAPTMLMALDAYLDALDVGDAPPSAFEPGRLRFGDDPPEGGPSIDPVVAEVEVVNDGPVRSGAPFEVRVRLTVKPPYHLNANPAGGANLVPTTVELDESSGVTLLGVDYPTGVAMTAGGQSAPIPVYQDEVILTARLEMAEGAAPGPLEIPIRVRYQACDDRACYPMAIVEAIATVEVAEGP